MPRDKQSIMNSPMAKAYASAEDDINGVVLPAEGTSILIIKDKGFDPKAFGELIKLEESKLEAGKKTNWKPGRLPSGGRIAENGVYIPADAMREDARKARMKK